MLECCDILDYIDELLYEIVDSNNNILYPKDKEKIHNFQKIISNVKTNDIIYYPDENKWYEYRIKAINKGTEIYNIKYLIDVSKYKIAEEKYKTDSLTSVLTRPTILEKINKELINCYENNIPFAIIIGDIDHFKDINDTYGHLIGDEALKSLGHILTEHINNDSEIVGRYGGEEFLFFFKNITLQETISKITKIKYSLDSLVIPYQKNNITNITMSFGIYFIENLNNENISKNEENNLIEGLINRADMALYKSKENGRNQAHLFSNDGFIEKVEYK